MTQVTDDVLLDWLEAVVEGRDEGDILDKSPGITVDDAYRLQFALMRRRADKGDRIIGYKAAYTNAAMQEMYGINAPSIGSLLMSGLYGEDEAIPVPARDKTNIEPEIAVLMGRDLRGPGVTEADALAAIEGLIPAIEVAPPSIGGRDRSRQMGVAVHKSNGGVVLGSAVFPPNGIDLRTEGAVLSINGRHRGSGTGVEVLGNPITVVAEVANLIGRHGETLAAGMIVMTGSIIRACQVFAGDRALVEFTRLGQVSATFVEESPPVTRGDA